MTLITVAFYVIVVALCLGAGLAVLFFVPLSIYVAPYCYWVGKQQLAGKQKDKLKDKEKLLYTAKCATKLYKSWITHKKPNF